MRWKHINEPRDVRIIKRFLLFPLTIKNETRWLEFCKIKQEFLFVNKIDPFWGCYISYECKNKISMGLSSWADEICIPILAEEWNRKNHQPTLKEQIELAKDKFIKAEKEYYVLKSKCTHNFVWDMNFKESAICEICGEDGGWYCPDSPDHICHYSESDDSCDYCGQPEERK